jgi:spermidine synthase
VYRDYVTDGSATTLDRVHTDRGELVLRIASGRFEIISNGVFLMDTSDGTSERLLVQAAIDACAAPAPSMLIGGLGVGFSLTEAVRFGQVRAIDVVEIEATIIGWHGRFLQEITGAARSDPRVSVIEADVIDWLAASAGRYDIICLDTDNGPNWLVFESNTRLYDVTGLDLAFASLRDQGVLALWSASRDPAFEDRLRERFGRLEILETPRDRGTPDIVYLARRVDAAGVPAA